MTSPSIDPPSQPQLTKRDLRRFAKRSLKHLLKRPDHLMNGLTRDDADLVEAIHQLRVASRKADVALRVFRDWIPNRIRSDQAATLKKVRVAAGAVRDLDLLEMRWRPESGAAASQVSTEAADWLHTKIQQQRSEAFDRLMHWSRKSRCRQRQKQTRRLLDRLPSRSAHRFESLTAHAIAKLVAAFCEAAPDTANSLAESHQTRIRARRLRYGIELLQKIIPDDTTQLISQLESVQEVLGQINDDATTNRFVRLSLSDCPDPRIEASLRAWLDRSEAAAADRLADFEIQIPSPTLSLKQFLSRTR